MKKIASHIKTSTTDFGDMVEKRLKETPRCDMDGFVPAEVDRKRLEKYIRRQEVESANRRAIREGRKVYDRDFLR